MMPRLLNLEPIDWHLDRDDLPCTITPERACHRARAGTWTALVVAAIEADSGPIRPWTPERKDSAA